MCGGGGGGGVEAGFTPTVKLWSCQDGQLT